MKIMDKKENYDKMLKNNRVEKKTDGVESDRELRKALLISVFLSLSIILQIAESFIFIPLFLPGIKLGLANIVTIIVLYVNKRSSQNRSNEDISCRNTEKWSWNKFSIFINWNIILTNFLKFFKKNWKIFYNGSKHCRSKFSYDRSDSSGFSCL